MWDQSEIKGGEFKGEFRKVVAPTKNEKKIGVGLTMAK